jgi:RNA polymerase sigma-70 factor (ECF subfamily)
VWSKSVPPLGAGSDSAVDREAEQLGRLFDEELDSVHGFLVARCGSTQIAEDVTGDVFVEAARRVAEGRGKEVTASWLMTVARRRLIDHWRRSATRSRTVESLARMRPPASAEGDDMDDRALAALSSLPDRQRAALTLRYLEEFSVSEIAEALCIGYQAAESLLARARRSFANAYRGHP